MTKQVKSAFQPQKILMKEGDRFSIVIDGVLRHGTVGKGLTTDSPFKVVRA